MNLQKLDSDLEAVLERAHGLDGAARREWQRRGTAEDEMSTTVPPDVLAVLCEGDEAEVRGEETHYAAHKKLVDIVRKFGEKLTTARRRYEGRMAELDGAMNPEAENMARERYEQEKIRLQVPATLSLTLHLHKYQVYIQTFCLLGRCRKMLYLMMMTSRVHVLLLAG